LEPSAISRPVARTLIALLLGAGVSQLCGVGVTLLAANALGAAGMGVLLFGLTLQSYASMFGTAALGPVLIREIGAKEERADRFVTAYLFLAGASTLLATVVGFAALVLVGPVGDERRLLTWILAGNLAASISCLPLFDAYHKQGMAAIPAAIVDLAVLGGFFALSRSGALTIAAAGLLFALKWATIAATQFSLFHTRVRRVRWVFDPQVVRAFVGSGGRILISYALFLIPLSAGVVLVRLWRTDAEAGVLGVAVQVAMAYLFFSYQVTRIAQPHIAGPRGLEREFGVRLVLAHAAATLALGLMAGAGATAVIRLMLRPEYRMSIPPMLLLLVAVWLMAVDGVLSVYLYRLHKETAAAWARGIAAIVYAAVAAWLVPTLGGIGAAVGTLCAALTAVVCLAVVLAGALRARASGDVAPC
jgi:O-antigen/teichoic acid export membrane protein